MSRYKNIDGADKVAAALKKLPAAAAKEVAAAMNKGAEEVAADARRLVPVGKTGRLKASIEIRRDQIGKARYAVRVVAGTDKATAISAGAQEFGRRAGPGAHPGHAKQPFMWPAYWKNRKRIRGRIKRAMRKAAKGVMGNG